MRLRTLRAGGRALVALCLAATVSTAVAQPSFTATPEPSTLAAARTIYRLDDAASYTYGCFPPCLCPIWQTDDIRGTFALTRTSSHGTVIEYAVDDVNWYVDLGAGATTRLTGAGTYTRIAGVAGWLHRLKLALSIDGAPAETFDSGLVSGGGAFPAIDVTISINGLYCLDTAIDVVASPVPPSEILCERLRPDSTYQEGCLPPCLCPILASTPLVGTFKLVELLDGGTVIEYAVIDVDWKVVAPYPTPSETFRGFGRYTRISGIAGWFQQMELDLRIDGGPLTRFDSGGVPGGGGFPAIDVALAMNGFYCYDIVLDVHARPCRRLAPSASSLALEE